MPDPLHTHPNARPAPRPLCPDQTATVSVFNYGLRRSNRAVAIATFKISKHSHPPPPTSKPDTISKSTETYETAESSYDGLGGA